MATNRIALCERKLAERRLIGTMLLVPEFIDDIIAYFKGEPEFVDERCGIWWRVACDLHPNGQTGYAELYVQEMRARGLYEQAGEAAFGLEVAMEVDSAADWPVWAEIVRGSGRALV